MRVLPDECGRRALREEFTCHDVKTSRETGSGSGEKRRIATTAGEAAAFGGHASLCRPYDASSDRNTLAPKRRADELHAVIARPLGRSRKGSKLTSVGVDEERGRHPHRLADRLEVLENLGGGIRVIGQAPDSGLPQPVFWLLGIAGID